MSLSEKRLLVGVGGCVALLTGYLLWYGLSRDKQQENEVSSAVSQTDTAAQTQEPASFEHPVGAMPAADTRQILGDSTSGYDAKTLDELGIGETIPVKEFPLVDTLEPDEDGDIPPARRLTAEEMKEVEDDFLNSLVPTDHSKPHPE